MPLPCWARQREAARAGCSPDLFGLAALIYMRHLDAHPTEGGRFLVSIRYPRGVSTDSRCPRAGSTESN